MIVVQVRDAQPKKNSEGRVMLSPELILGIIAVILQAIQVWQNRKPRYKGKHRK